RYEKHVTLYGVCLGRIKLYKTNAERQRAYRKNKKPYYAKRTELRKILEDKAIQEVKAIQGVYDVVVIDPPWPVEFMLREVRPNQGGLAYPTMTLDEIYRLRIPLADIAHVWLWATHRFLAEAFACLSAWDLDYSCCFVWM